MERNWYITNALKADRSRKNWTRGLTKPQSKFQSNWNVKLIKRIVSYSLKTFRVSRMITTTHPIWINKRKMELWGYNVNNITNAEKEDRARYKKTKQYAILTVNHCTNEHWLELFKMNKVGVKWLAFSTGWPSSN